MPKPEFMPKPKYDGVHGEIINNRFSYHSPKENQVERYQDIRNEGRNKLAEIKPKTVGQANRIQGVTPADVSLLISWLDK